MRVLIIIIQRFCGNVGPFSEKTDRQADHYHVKEKVHISQEESFSVVMSYCPSVDRMQYYSTSTGHRLQFASCIITKQFYVREFCDAFKHCVRY